MAQTDNIQSGCYPISTVSALTGINSVTLRAWERRYGILSPERTDSGHRLYSEADIERIREVQRLLAEGVPISQVGNRIGAGAAAVAAAGQEWQDRIDRMIAAISAFDEAELEELYNEVLGLYPTDRVSKHLLLPLLRRLGDRWESGDGSVAEEHFFSVFLRNKIGARFHHRPRHPEGPVLLAACLPGEQHELGLLLFCLAANERGFRIVLLGADMPLREIPLVMARTRIDAVVLSGSINPPEELLEQDLRQLVRRLPVPVFIGGRTASRHQRRLQAAGALPVGEDLALAVGRIAEHPALSEKV